MCRRKDEKENNGNSEKQKEISKEKHCNYIKKINS